MEPQFITFSQNFEDLMLWRALKGVERGTWIDVGAAHPVIDSVTKAFSLRGWTGLNLEPNPVMFTALSQDRPNDVNLQIAVSNVEGQLTFYEFAESGWATLDSNVAECHLHSGHAYRESQVPVMRLDDVLTKLVTINGPIHFLKIDVEGHELSVLSGIDLNKWRPWLVMVEATFPNSTKLTHHLWEHILLESSYTPVYFDGLNRIYCHSDKLEQFKPAFSVPPNPFDNYIRYNEVVLSQMVRELQEKLASFNK